MKTAKTHSPVVVYQYNADTCAYEPHKRSFFNYVIYGFLLLLTAGSFLIGLLFVHDYLFESPNEKQLETENRLLKKYTGILSAELKQIENKLGHLEEKDKRLHKKFFTTEPSISSVEKDEHAILLTSGISDFCTHLNNLVNKSDKITESALSANAAFSQNLSLDKRKLTALINLPVITPIENFTPGTILSGFGTRINPFHKALHHHPGVDIAVPRGTNVIATASGVIKTAKRSDLQAGYGNYIEIDHGNGVSTRYAHLETLSVKAGQSVPKGALIGTSGNSGGSVAPHLHYEVIRNGENVDPVYYFISGVSPEDYAIIHTTSRSENQSLD